MPPTLAGERLADVLAAVAAATPAPGGGAVTAVVGAFAAALVGMVCGVSAKRKGTSDGQRAGFAAVQAQAEACRTRLLALADEDAAAYASVLAAHRLPKEDTARPAAIENALRDATQVPLQVVALCAEVAALARQLVEQGIPTAAGDALVAVLLAEAAAQGAASNARINTAGMREDAFVVAARVDAGDRAAAAWRARIEAVGLMAATWE